MTGVSIVDFGSYLPERQVDVSFFFEDGDPLADSALLRAPQLRHHVAREERAADMVAAAAQPLFERLGLEPAGNVDLLVTNVLLPDNPITGSGAEVAHRLGCTPAAIVDLHNGGCAAFPYMLQLAGRLMHDGSVRSALLCTVQNGGGRLCALPEARRQVQSALPGDGCGVAYVVAGEKPAPVLAAAARNAPAAALDMGLGSPDGRLYWEPGASELAIRMNVANLKQILDHGNRVVPELVTELCARVGATPADLDLLVTNQPNRVYLRNWREALGLEPERHLDTFDRCGNLMSASVPVTLDHALRAGAVRDGALIALAGFAHAGDLASAALVRWGAGA
ncbi:MAG TPA: 3-oxoacyl-[acyl-carrier-protein] synthase III C-terminal domain-containing protein [Conexibacter sp.]|nr:3-oxoacyl-[acyl-carrier-protein] synthase III C-terminal domain-containing protein [Conexibacter sp.]